MDEAPGLPDARDTRRVRQLLVTSSDLRETSSDPLHRVCWWPDLPFPTSHASCPRRGLSAAVPRAPEMPPPRPRGPAGTPPGGEINFPFPALSLGFF